MLRVDLREVHRGPLDTTGVLQPEDPAFEGLELGLAGPVSVEGRLQETGPGEFFWRGTVRGEVRRRSPMAALLKPCKIIPTTSCSAGVNSSVLRASPSIGNDSTASVSEPT